MYPNIQDIPWYFWLFIMASVTFPLWFPFLVVWITTEKEDQDTKIYCPKCGGKTIKKGSLPDYSRHCPDCGEDFYDCELTEEGENIPSKRQLFVALFSIIAFSVFLTIGAIHCKAAYGQADPDVEFALTLMEARDEMIHMGCDFSCPYVRCIGLVCWNTNVKPNGHEDLCDIKCVILKLGELKTGLSILQLLGAGHQTKEAK